MVEPQPYRQSQPRFGPPMGARRQDDDAATFLGEVYRLDAKADYAAIASIFCQRGQKVSRTLRPSSSIFIAAI